jgi:TnpA family transposase
MARRKLLTPDECQALLGIPDDEESLIRHYTLSAQDRLQAEARRRPHNQLGYAVQLCMMRFPGRILGAGETPPAAVVAYVAEQLGIDPGAFASYGHRIWTRFAHSRRLAQYLGIRTATRDDRRAALLVAAEAASATESGLPIMTAMVTELRHRGVLLLPDAALKKIGIAGRAIARQRAEAALLEALAPDQLDSLDTLLIVDPAIQQTRLAWLRSAPDAPSADNLIGLMDRLTFVRTLAIDPQRQARLHPERWTQIVRESDVTPAWLVADFGTRRRRATLVAQAITLEQELTDAAVTMFNKLIGRLFARANVRRKQRYVNAQQDTTKVLRLFRDTLRALVIANDTGRSAIDVLDDVVGWKRLLQAQPEVEAMVRDADPDPLLLAAERYHTIRKYTARFLEAFTFCSSRRHDSLLAAIGTLRSLNATNRRTLPDRVPVGHLSTKSRKLIFMDAKPDRRLYEIATLAVLRERLRSGDIWIEGSHAFRPMDEQLMPKPAFAALKASDDLGLGVPQDAVTYLSEARQTLDFNLKRLAYRARNGKLEGVRLEAGQLVVTPLPGDVPAAAEELKWELADMYPLIEVPDLLMEVHAWTGFADRFTHIRTQEAPRSIPAMLAGVLADATNLGARRMAAASKGVSPQEIAWKRIFHTPPETYKLAQACITDQHAQHPHARLWGDGFSASSDGQFFQASDRAGPRSDINLHYGSEPGSKFYSHLSDQYGYFSILPISATESEAPYVLDGLFDHETSFDIQEHFTDTGGASDHVFGLFALTGRRFAPRLRNLKDRKLHTFEKPDAYPALQEHIGVPINTSLIMEYWDDLLHLAASIQTRTVAPSTILKRLAASRNPSQLARALRELGRLERTLFMIEWYSDPALRRRC